MVAEKAAHCATIDVRIGDQASKSKKVASVLQIGNVAPMLKGGEGSMGVRLNRDSPKLASMSKGKSALPR